MIRPTLKTFLERPKLYVDMAKQGETIVILDDEVEIVLTKKGE